MACTEPFHLKNNKKAAKSGGGVDKASRLKTIKKGPNLRQSQPVLNTGLRKSYLLPSGYVCVCVLGNTYTIRQSVFSKFDS